MKNITVLFVTLCLIFSGCGGDNVSFSSGKELILCQGGNTEYVIVEPDSKTAVDSYAIEKLVVFLKGITSADFKVVTSSTIPQEAKCIYVGISKPVTKRFKGNPVSDLKAQEHVAESKGNDIFLYGEGIHGNLYAVVDFLETYLGWRWYSVREHPYLPECQTVVLKKFSRKKGFSFLSRETQHRGDIDFYYLNGINMGYKGSGKVGSESPYVSFLRTENFVHSSFSYIPPDPNNKYAKKGFKWLKKKDYFKTNPEFFTMAANGKRVANKQLCFSNPDLRKEFTKNVLTHLKVSGDDQYITVDAADTPDRFCYCEGCRKLEEKYKCPGGPIFDYIFELCEILKEKHPGVYVKALAYRRAQTQQPPVMPAGKKFPENLIATFAGIEDSYFADWTHPDERMQETYSHLKQWCKLSKNVWVWIYPNPWGSGAVMPVGNIERIINCARTIHRAGANGFFTDHNGINQRSGFAEIQTYLLLNLMKDINCDTEKLTKEFTDYMYEDGAPIVRKYMKELEQGRKEIAKLQERITFNSRNFDLKTFPYLTPENIYRWQKYFDEIESLLKDKESRKNNALFLRRELDFATLCWWFDLKKAYPDYFIDYTIYENRINFVNKLKTANGGKISPLTPDKVKDFVAIIKGGGKRKPLPEEFDGIEESRIKEFVPTNYARGNDKKIIGDPDAAFGYAATVYKPDMPFKIGFYQWFSRNPVKGKELARLVIKKDQITPGEYKIYKLGDVEVTADSWVWFSAKSWATRLEAGTKLFMPGEENKWTVYVSIKLDGPSYGGKAEKDEVLCDRIIFVEKK